MTQQKIITNKIRCKQCGDIIESTHVHDFKWCSCQQVAIDGGHEYLKRSFHVSPDEYEDLSEWEEVEIPEDEDEYEEN